MSGVSPQRRRLELAGAGAVDPAPADGAERVRLRFLPEGAEVRVPSGTPVFDAASWNGIAIDSTCGGHGTCKKCRVRIVSGDVPVGPLDPRAFTVDELREGWRLACRASARGDLVVEVPPLADPAEGRFGRRRAARHPAAGGAEAASCAGGADDGGPALGSPAGARCARRSRAARLDRDAAVFGRGVAVGPGSTSPRSSCDQELIDLEPGDTTARRFAIAFDLGTTTVVATLLDLESGQPVAVRSILNRQQPYGADVITRISATMMDSDALGALGARVHETMASLVDEVCADGSVDPREVYEITVCGNVTMMHLALGIDPEPLSMAPFVVSTHSFPRRARARLRGRGPPAGAGVRIPVVGRVCGRRHRRRDARHGPDAGPSREVVHRRRHQQRDRARLGRARGGDGGAGGSGVRGGADQVRDAGFGGRDRGRQDLLR